MIDYHNGLRNLVGNCSEPKRKPSYKRIVENIVNGLAQENGNGICWNPIGENNTTQIYYKQCPGACGHVWKFNIADEDVSNWLVNRINEKSVELTSAKES